jgi:phage shock protein C
MLGGVCGGLGQYFNVDPVFFRLGFVLLTLGWGAGLLVYIVLWIVIPPRGFGEPEPFVVNHFDRHRGGEVVAWILIGVGLLVLASNLQIFQPWMWGQIWPVALIVAGVLLLTNSSLVHRGDR